MLWGSFASGPSLHLMLFGSILAADSPLNSPLKYKGASAPLLVIWRCKFGTGSILVAG